MLQHSIWQGIYGAGWHGRTQPRPVGSCRQRPEQGGQWVPELIYSFPCCLQVVTCHNTNVVWACHARPHARTSWAASRNVSSSRVGTPQPCGEKPVRGCSHGNDSFNPPTPACHGALRGHEAAGWAMARAARVGACGHLAITECAARQWASSPPHPHHNARHGIRSPMHDGMPGPITETCSKQFDGSFQAQHVLSGQFGCWKCSPAHGMRGAGGGELAAAAAAGLQLPTSRPVAHPVPGRSCSRWRYVSIRVEGPASKPCGGVQVACVGGAGAPGACSKRLRRLPRRWNACAAARMGQGMQMHAPIPLIAKLWPGGRGQLPPEAGTGVIAGTFPLGESIDRMRGSHEWGRMQARHGHETRCRNCVRGVGDIGMQVLCRAPLRLLARHETESANGPG